MRTRIKKAFHSNPKLPNQSRLLKSLQKGSNRATPKKFFFTNYPCIIGIEIEVESLRVDYGAVTNIWRCVEEGSLKDCGVELLTCPIQGRNIDYALAELDSILQEHPRHYFNHRCSTHIHINVSALTTNQLTDFMALYIALEPYFWAFVDDDLRRNNGYCVPLTEVGLNKSDILLGVHTEHSKYLALAYNHLSDFGTLEMRQMVGTGDMRRLRRWIMMIQKTMWYALKQNSIKDLSSDFLAKAVFNTLFNHIPTPNKTDVKRSREAAIFFNS